MCTGLSNTARKSLAGGKTQMLKQGLTRAVVRTARTPTKRYEMK